MDFKTVFANPYAFICQLSSPKYRVVTRNYLSANCRCPGEFMDINHIDTHDFLVRKHLLFIKNFQRSLFYWVLTRTDFGDG